MKILVVASGDYRSNYGGGQTYVRSVVKSLIRLRHQVTVGSLRFVPRSTEFTLLEQKGEMGEHIVDYTIPQPAHVPDRPATLHASVDTIIQRILGEICPDVVHINGWKDSFALACHERGVPCVITIHHGGVICPGGALLDWEGKICQRPIVDHVCGDCCVRALPGGSLVRLLAHPIPISVKRDLDSISASVPQIPVVSAALRMYTAPARLRASLQAFRLPGTLIISPSKSIAEALIRNGISQTQITVLHHGVETYRRTPIVEGLGKRPLRLIYVGRINPVKGLHVLLRAISNITPSSTWQLDIVGQPVTKKEHRYHRKLLAQGSLLPVSWHGQKTHEEVGQLIAQSDVLVLPSICLEAFGLVVPEALSTGRPVIATRCGGPEEIIDHGINGLLVEPGNSKDLEDAIRNLVINPHKVSEMSDAIQPVQDMESHVTLLLAIYYSAMAMRPTSRRSTEPVPHV